MLVFQVLLACGGDPRVRADDGAEPEQVSTCTLCPHPLCSSICRPNGSIGGMILL